MMPTLWWEIALLLGLVEGATEFLPVSSTGHLVVAGALVGFQGEAAATFEIVIQVGAIAAVIWVYRAFLLELLQRFSRPGEDRRVAINLGVGFLPAAVVGLALHHWIKTHLFTPTVVAGAFIVGGLLILLIERLVDENRTGDVRRVTVRQAALIGCAQILALIPGTSRSAATILGGYSVGLTRAVATEFSFLLAIPTLLAAAAYDLWKSRHLFTAAAVPMFAVGMVVSFLVALLVIRQFLRFVKHHSFNGFAWYRIAAGLAILLLVHFRVLSLDVR